MEKYNDLYEKIKALPKIELHCHLDGSLSPDFVKNTLELSETSSQISQSLIAPGNCKSLKEYLNCFDLPVKCLQSEKNITLGIMDVMAQAAAENVKYIELRFAPALSLQEGLTYREIYEASIEGLRKGKAKYDIDGNIIVCAMRHHSQETNIQVLKEALPYLGQGICAMDLAGDEAAFDNEKFVRLFEAARKYNMPFTIHSGECGRAENVRISLSLGAKRVGHGIALIKEPELMVLCAERKLGIEMCPTSNFQTGAVSSDEIYPLRKFLDTGLSVCINTDNRTVSHTTMSDELYLCVSKLGLTENELASIYRNSIELTFADDNIKNHLYSLIW